MSSLPRMRIRGLSLAAAMGASLALSLMPEPAMALGPFCAAHPLNPLCCPSPCPIIDAAKLGEFVGEAQKIWDGVERCRQTVEQYVKIAVTFGPNGPLATELKQLPGNATAILTTFRTDLPASVRAGDLANPRAVAEMLKNALIDPDQLAVHKVTSDTGRLADQVKAAGDETINALADSYHAYATLAAAVVDHQDATRKASSAKDLRGDVTANSQARRGLAESLGGLQEVLASWAAGEATAGIKGSSRSLGPLPGQTLPDKSALAGQTAEKTARLEQLRDLRAQIDDMDGLASGLVDLHNQRHAALLMRAQYPALRNTLDSYQAALNFRAGDAAAAINSLSLLFTDGPRAFSLAAEALRGLDATDWRDGGKAAAAAAAAAAVATGIAAQPERFGTPVKGDPEELRQAQQDLSARFSAWLEDDKLERYWRGLRDDASATLVSLDDRSAELTSRFGFDLASSDAFARELVLLSQFDAACLKFRASDLSSVSPDQRGDLTAYAQAFSNAADAVRADASADIFVLVRWPQ